MLMSLPSLLLFSGLALAHPGHDITEEKLERREYLSNAKRSNLAHCAPQLKARSVHDRNVARRVALLEDARRARGLSKRDVEDVLATDHEKTELGFDASTPYSELFELFAGNASCVLTPEVTVGPYYVGGEDIRRNIVESEPGVELLLDYQVIDVDTCEPVPDAYIEIWHSNSTGVYSGVVAGGNGNQADAGNIDATFLRGIQKTDTDGVAQFETLFPGHYQGRTAHIHILIHTNATEYANNTLGNNVYASHVGQSFFDQDLITAVEEVSPYTENTQALTTNEQDGILAEEASTTDPVALWTLLGDSVADGLLGWLAFGIDTSATNSVAPATFRYEEGGVKNPNAGGPGGPGGPPTE